MGGITAEARTVRNGLTAQNAPTKSFLRAGRTMDRQISYSERDITAQFKWIVTIVNRMESSIELMEEQVACLRKGLEWKSSSGDLRTNIEKLKEALNSFGIEKLTVHTELQQPHNCFENHHLEMIKKRFQEHLADTDDLY